LQYSQRDVCLRVDLQATLDPAHTSSIIGKLHQALITDYRAVTAKAREDARKPIESAFRAAHCDLKSLAEGDPNRKP
jgi:hypothetical protein